MTERHETNLQAMARHVLETLHTHGDVTLEITSDEDEARRLLRLITELHTLATRDRIGITLIPLGERGIRLRLGLPDLEAPT